MDSFRMLTELLLFSLNLTALSTSSAEINSKTARVVEIIVPSVVGLLLLLVGVCICVKKVKKRRKEATPLPLRNAQSTPFRRRNQIAASSDAQDDSLHNGQGNNKDCDLRSFDVEKIQAATDNFSTHNKIGQGGFGPVYMVTSISVLTKSECRVYLMIQSRLNAKCI